MRLRFVVLAAFLTLLAIQVAHAQSATPQPSCEDACRVNPFTAPAGCDCDAIGGETTQPTNQPAPAEPGVPDCEVACRVNPFTAPAGCDCDGTGGGITQPTDQPAPAEPGVPDCEVACRVNPFTAPESCNCNGSTPSELNSGVGSGAAAPVSSSSAAPAASSSPSPVRAPVADAALRDLVLRSWAAQPGETVRNSFGPDASDCRGACGPGCAAVQSCERGARYECLDTDRLLRIETYSCGTHQGCRIHDDCLDRCHQANAQGVDCEATCHLEAIAEYGPENAMSWLQGGGPYDAEPIYFEYTRSAPDRPEPFYRCPEGARRECGAAARCVTASGVDVEPVFDSFPGAGGTMGISAFRAGRLCEQGPGSSAVCEQTIDIRVTGADTCAQGARRARCTRFGFEFGYERADPAVPLVCSASSRGGSRDLASMAVAQALSPVVSGGQGTDLGAAVGGIQEALRSGQSLESVFSGISITPLDENGRPTGSARGASPAPSTATPTPNRVAVEGASGRLVVPLYELHDPTRAGEVVERTVECSYRGAPVLETLFRLHHTGN